MKIKKRALTLLEIMIVIFLIGLIGSVIGYNMKGSLDEGRAFKTEQGAAQIRDILLLEVAKGKSRDDVMNHPERYLANSGMVKDVKKILKDGWGKEYEIVPNGKTDIKIISTALQEHKQKKRQKAAKKGEVIEEEAEEFEADED